MYGLNEIIRMNNEAVKQYKEKIEEEENGME